MKRLILLFAATIMSLFSYGQTIRAYERAGEVAMKKKDYAAAAAHFQYVLAKKPEKFDVWYKFAECAKLLYAFDEAEKALLRVEQNEKTENYPLLYLELAEVNRGQGNYTAALDYLGKFDPEKAGIPGNSRDRAQKLRIDCTWALQHLNENSDVRITNLGKNINSPFSDFAPVQMGDTLFFSSYRFDKKGDKSAPKQKITRLMWSIGNGKAREIGRGIPAGDSTHVAHSAFMNNGNFLFFTNCKNLNTQDIRCEIYLTVRDIRGRWGKPQKLPAPVNIPGYTATQPSIGFDSLSLTSVLWFASDRPGGKGGLDIWHVPLDTIDFCPCSRPLSGRKFYMPVLPEPENMAALNTSGNDISPFFHEKQQQLYFSSDGWPGFGGYDVYVAEADTAGLLEIKNLGPVVNSSYNDTYFSLQSDERHALLSSNRPGSQYLDVTNKACCNDLYTLLFPEPRPVMPPDSMPRLPVPQPEPPVPQPEIPPQPVLQSFVGLLLYFDNDEPDKRTLRTTTKKNYEETVIDYLERQDVYREQFALGLNGAAETEAEVAIDSFFDNEVRAGYERLSQLAEVILQHLQKGEKVEILIRGFTSPRAQSDYNLNLGKRRISSVRNYFEGWSNGVLAEYLEAGQLQVSETSFGETRASSAVSDKIEDLRNSIYNPEAAKERRVEIVKIIAGVER